MSDFQVNLLVSGCIFLSPYLLKLFTKPSALPGIVTTLGVLGTFFGIFFALLAFDVRDVQASVPPLLRGLQLAFMTSIAGMCAALLLKLFPWIFLISREQASTDKEEATLEEVVRLLGKIDKGISGEGETTLVTQIQKMRTSLVDKQDELNQSFIEFASKVVADSTQSLVEALTQVMKDFNTKINEQFGENFKQLNEAVGKMLEWQKEYSARIEVMTKRFQQTTDNTEKASKELAQIARNADEFRVCSEKLESTVSRQSLSDNSHLLLRDS
jgi:methyl-accepting chemotaxis protein